MELTREQQLEAALKEFRLAYAERCEEFQPGETRIWNERLKAASVRAAQLV